MAEVGGCKDQAFIFLSWIDFVIETAKDLHQGRGHLPAGRERPGVYAVGLVALPHRCLEMARTEECTSPAFKLKNFTTEKLLMFAGQPTWITYLFYQLLDAHAACCMPKQMQRKQCVTLHRHSNICFLCVCCLLRFVSISSGLPKGIYDSYLVFQILQEMLSTSSLKGRCDFNWMWKFSLKLWPAPGLGSFGSGQCHHWWSGGDQIEGNTGKTLLFWCCPQRIYMNFPACSSMLLFFINDYPSP